MFKLSFLLASLVGVALSQDAAPCIDVNNVQQAQIYAKSLDVTKLTSGTVESLCFDGGVVTLDKINNVSDLIGANGAALKGKFTKNGVSQPLSCTLPTETVQQIIAAATNAGSTIDTTKFKFSCVDGNNANFLSFNGVSLTRGDNGGGGGVIPSPPSAPVDPPAPVEQCLTLPAILANPTLLLKGGCVKVPPFQGVFRSEALNLQKIADDIRAGRAVSITGSYVRPDATFSVTCSVDQKTLQFVLPLLASANPTVDIAAAKNNIAISCKTSDGKRQFGITGADIRGLDIDGNKVDLGDRKIDLGDIKRDVIGGQILRVGGFELVGDKFTLPGGRVITLTPEDVLKFASNNIAIINGKTIDGKTIVTLAGPKGQVAVVDGKVSFTAPGADSKPKDVSGQMTCDSAQANGEKLTVTCQGRKYSVDETGNLLPEAVEQTNPTTIPKSSSMSLTLAAAATVASLFVSLF